MEDEEMLSMVKEDIVEYQKAETEFQYLSYLTPQERAELKKVATEDPDKDTINFEKFKNNINNGTHNYYKKEIRKQSKKSN